jgi:hypothetical protein
VIRAESAVDSRVAADEPGAVHREPGAIGQRIGGVRPSRGSSADLRTNLQSDHSSPYRRIRT